MSPVWRAKLCGRLGSQKRQLDLEGEDEAVFRSILDLGVGSDVMLPGGLGELLAIGRTVDRYQVEVVQGAVEEAALGLITIQTCAEVLSSVWGSGLRQLEAESRDLALREFDAVADTPGFLALDHDAVAALLEEDGLTADREEGVFHALARWMRAGPAGALRGPDLLRRIRFPLMDSLFLADRARGVLPGAGPALEDLVLEASVLKGIPGHLWAGRPLQHLDARALTPRRGRWDVCWERCAAGRGERRLPAGQLVGSVTVHQVRSVTPCLVSSPLPHPLFSLLSPLLPSPLSPPLSPV